MCIGNPMQVLEVSPGHAWCADGGARRRVGTALVGTVRPGDWLLVFLDDAREQLSPERAAEITATLALVAGALQGASADTAAFDLPSRHSAEQLRALTGAGQPIHPRTGA
ncbi:MAG: HypC/HybG/HupF family hydrogenase formation chaperone [Hydrogenophaga sp.]|uniref:HypC/HybG/HupF family hydrogenase formation chaperone n=1 Tax=Hydrogenophaga sp. TaxID=1904254 RepID=UPI001D6A5B51|nr:HypC/HybG/HupF family hydrogenase formation chaperone [Hydrogenophaga sp.]MBX3609046.1 HypC/HybG/HupF family hydrogenase formation chaperone [Hydrogenophaga sp.]